MGLLGGEASKRGHCRNRPIAWLFALLVAGSGLGSYYFADYKIGMRKHLEELPLSQQNILSNEMNFSRWLQLRMHAGWKLKSTGLEIDGGMVCVVWILEGLIVVSFCFWMLEMSVKAPYCEPCGQWTESVLLRFPVWDGTAVRDCLDRDDLSGVIHLPARTPMPTGSSMQLELKAHLCKTCDQTSYLSIDEIVPLPEKKRQPKERRTHLIESAHLTREQRMQFLRRMTNG